MKCLTFHRFFHILFGTFREDLECPSLRHRLLVSLVLGAGTVRERGTRRSDRGARDPDSRPDRLRRRPRLPGGCWTSRASKRSSLGGRRLAPPRGDELPAARRDRPQPELRRQSHAEPRFRHVVQRAEPLGRARTPLRSRCRRPGLGRSSTWQRSRWSWRRPARTRPRSGTSIRQAIRRQASAAPSRSPAGRSTTPGSIDHIDFLVDGRIVAGAVGQRLPSTGIYGLPRPGRLRGLPGRPELGQNSGFLANIDTTAFVDGVHMISVRAVDNQGVLQRPRHAHGPDHQQRLEPAAVRLSWTSRWTRLRSSVSPDGPHHVPRGPALPCPA